MLVLDGERPSGVARLDQRKPGVYDVSILVDPDRQGRGIGKAALSELRKLRPGAVFEAEVMAENEPSIGLFLAAGYVRENGKYIQRSSVRAVFRADASASIGGGHTMRCLALADALSRAGWACAFATRRETMSVVPALAESGHRIIDLHCAIAEEPETIANECGNTVEWLVVDHYQRSEEFETASRSWAKRVLAIDDLADRSHDCDLLLDQAPGRKEKDYRNFTNSGCRFLLGPDYALLRPQFAKARDSTPNRNYSAGSIKKILVALGAVDAGNRTVTVMQAVAMAECKAEIDVVLGPGAPHINKIRELVGSLPYNFTVHTDVRDMAAMMAATDLVIGAAGTSSWERCCLGVPSIAIVTADNQQDFASSLRANGAAEVFDGRAEISAEVLGRKIRDLSNDVGRLNAMACAASKICDGLGTERVFSAMTGIDA